MASNENLPPKVIKDLARELRNLEESPLEDIKISVNNDTFSNIHADIEGPSGTPYEGGSFRVKLVLSQGFPEAPPKGFFLTKIFHPNISKSGEICVNTLKKDWKPTLGLRHILLAIRCLLIEPFPESALNEEAGKMLMEDYESYHKYARLMTSIHAITNKPRMKSSSGESRKANTVSTDPDAAFVLPLKQTNTNRENNDATLSPMAADTVPCCVSPSKKLKSENSSGTAHTHKRKCEHVRKKGLKRL